MKNMKKATLKIMIPLIINLFIVWGLGVLTLTGVVKPSLYAFDADANGTVALYKRHQLTVISEDGSERTFSCECDIPKAISIEGSAIRISMPGSYILLDMNEETMTQRLPAQTDMPKQQVYRTVTVGDRQIECRNRWFRYSVVEKLSDGTYKVRYLMPLSEYVVKLALMVFYPLFAVLIIVFLIHLLRNYKFTKSGRPVPRN